MERGLEWPVARLYTEKYLKQEDKDRISAMVDDILADYHGILEDADFLSEETKAKAVEKLEAIQKYILYPDDWSKYSCEELSFATKEEGGNYWDALEAIGRFRIAKSVKEYSEPVDKAKWIETPHTVNCFYSPQTNGIYIMGAFARGGFYNSEMSDEELYGAIGTAIGHEISHAFDSKGAQFDKTGDMRSWWTEEDYAKFLERNKKMVDFYNAMHPWEGQDFYGSIMTGEACADMAGVKVMLKIAEEHPDFDYDKFFRTFANNWLTKDTLQRAYVRINDTHPMCYLRINATLQQYDEFLDYYGITEGDGMYLAPEDRRIMDAKRGYVPEDERNFSQDAVKRMKDASRHIRYLINEGYDLKQATVFVGNHFLLSERQRLAIMRSVAADQDLAERKSKQLSISELNGREVWIDGFNTVITLEVLLSDSLLFSCMDGTIRDLAALRGTYRLIPETAEAVQLMFDILQEASVRKVNILLDEPVSNSGRLKSMIAEKEEPVHSFDLDIRILRDVDRTLYGKEGVITSDSIILDHCSSWFNLTAECLRRKGKQAIRVW